MASLMATKSRFETVPQPVKARRLFIDERVTICGRPRLCPAGMWVVEAVGGAGDNLLVPDDIFRINFRPTDTQSEAAWKEQTKKVWPVWENGEPLELN